MKVLEAHELARWDVKERRPQWGILRLYVWRECPQPNPVRSQALCSMPRYWRVCYLGCVRSLRQTYKTIIHHLASLNAGPVGPLVS